MTYDLIIVGGGPAGTSAAVYAARKQLRTLLILKEWGGQSTVSEDIQNWIGTPHISGAKLAESLKQHVMEYKGEFLDIKDGSYVSSASRDNNQVKIKLEDGSEYTSSALLITTGSQRRKLDAVNADVFEHKGLTYCASCDGPFFSGMDVVVVGGGNAGFESAAQLLAYCKSVTLLSRSAARADAITVEKLKSNPKFKLIENAVPTEVHGDKFVNALSYRDSDGQVNKLEVSGIFVEVGQIPATAWCKDIATLDDSNRVKIDPWTQQAGDNVWAAGDCTNILYHQNNIASGDAVRAIEDIYVHLRTK
jgi:alkyl hydroperoxide reductase subunit F